MKIQVFGSGCPSCKKLHKLVKKVILEQKIEAELEYVMDVQAMIDMVIMQSPALAIDGRPVSAGFVPNEEQIIELIEKNGNLATGQDKKCCCGNC
jgi:small redox-active disulfide protein 2